MRILLSCLLALGIVLAVSVSANAALTHCEDYKQDELRSISPTMRIEWLTEELERCNLSPREKFALYFERGTAWLAKGNPRFAVDDLNAAIDLHAGYTEAYINRAVAHTDLGLFEQAVMDYKAALAIDPNYALTHNGLAWTLYESGEDLEEALLHSKKALSLEPDFWGWYDTYGHVLAALGHPDEAMAAFERALRLSEGFNVRRYQQALKDKGFDPGPIDGLYGDRTRAALEACVSQSCNIWAH